MKVDLKHLEERCCCPRSAFEKEGKVLQQHPNRLIYQDNGASVLAIAHLDFVGNKKPAFSYAETKAGKHLVFCDRLDDRLGAYAILDYLPAMGIEVDVLLTDNEEKGKSTARDFKPDKQYNWLAQFDRQGTSVVMYQYDTPELRKMLKGYSLDPQYGSFSCVGCMESLGVSGFNFGIGYHNQHTARSYASLEEFECMMEDFSMMYWCERDNKMVHTPKPKTYGNVWQDLAAWRQSFAYQDRYGDDGDTEDFLSLAEIQKHNNEIDRRDGNLSYHDMSDEEWAIANAAYDRIRVNL